MNFQPLFTTSRVVVAVYKTVSTTVLLYYLLKRLSDEKPHRNQRNPYDDYGRKIGY